ncbi:MAG: DNA methyltransferase [Variovorax sp.]
MHQSDLFEPLLAAYRGVQIEEHGVTNAELYRSLNLEPGARAPVGRSRQLHNLEHRKIRWHQQSMRKLGLIERVPGQRGTWRLTPRARKEGDLTRAPEGVAMIACSTTLGVAIWTRSETIASQVTDQISAIITSPPYPLRSARAYGGPAEDEYVDFICNALEPLLKNLVPGGTVALNLSNDIFISKSPARSIYLELLTIALQRRLGLYLHERLVWANPSKVPGPTFWASITRQHLNAGHEPVLIFCNDPVRCLADNRRVLQPHTEQHAKLISRGGEQRTATYGDGAYKLRPGSFSAQTAGRIPRNVLTVSHSSGEVREARKMAKDLGLALHSALMPVKLARLLVEFLVPPDGMVLDLFGGWLTTALACEQSGRRWIAFEQMAEYAAGGALRLRESPGFIASFDLAGWMHDSARPQ